MQVNNEEIKNNEIYIQEINLGVNNYGDDIQWNNEGDVDGYDDGMIWIEDFTWYYKTRSHINRFDKSNYKMVLNVEKNVILHNIGYENIN